VLLAEAEKTLTQQLITGFDNNSIAYTLDNAPDGFVSQESETEKVECSINVLSSQQVSLGGVGTRVFRRTGDIVCKVYTAKDSGSRRDKEIVDIILNLFEGKQFSGIVMQTISFLRIGPVGDWHLTTVRIPFYFDIEDI
jgi:hypothetical protein